MFSSYTRWSEGVCSIKKQKIELSVCDDCGQMLFFYISHMDEDDSTFYVNKVLNYVLGYRLIVSVYCVEII